MITVDFILGLMWLLLIIGSLVFSVYAFAQFVMMLLPGKTKEEPETENEAAARRRRQVTLAPLAGRVINRSDKLISKDL